MSHTPAPWYVERDAATNKPEFIRAFVHDEMFDIADVLCDETGNAAANAQLLAAAPELLAALHEIVLAAEAGELDEYGTSGDWFREAKAAITKATGDAQ